MKIQRHAAILRVVRERRIESQDELREALASDGFIVTQATLSRDIRELGLAKLADPQGGAFYTHPHRAAVRPDLAQVLPAELAGSVFGPELQAAVVTMTARNRVSRRDMSELAGELFGIGMSVGKRGRDLPARVGCARDPARTTGRLGAGVRGGQRR